MRRFTRLEAALIEALGGVAVLFIIAALFFGNRHAAEAPKCAANLARQVPVAGSLPALKIDSKIEDGADLDLPLAMADLPYETPAMARAFGARTKEVRLLLARMNGGGDDTENAVEMALGYLARIQKEDGSWSKPVPLGSTGLALICFLGAGYHHQDGDYKEVVSKGLKYLLSHQKENGGLDGETVYSHAIAGMVFSEAYGLTADPVCRQAAEKMLDFLARAQNDKGAWAYEPSSPDCDTSVSGWAIMAFKSAKMAGLPIPHETVEKYLRYAKSITEAEVNTAEEAKKNNGIWKGMAHYGIRNGKPDKRFPYPMTASVLMCRLYMENDRNAPLLREGIEHI
ncbi:MAG: terpene cyclase/mutase family protein, partial [Planctomycetota bacterium]|nr:terpene cyclase/mutase family protein [Planctomycetota bacterium]